MLQIYGGCIFNKPPAIMFYLYMYIHTVYTIQRTENFIHQKV